MSLKETIQQKVILQKQRKRHANSQINKAFIPLTKAKVVGIVLDCREQNNLAPGIDFYKKIKASEKQIQVLILIPEKRETINLYDYEKHFTGAHVHVLCPEELTFWGVPKGGSIDLFLNNQFDILVRLCMKHDFLLDIILLKCKAKMLAGCRSSENDYLDFGMDLKKEAKLEVLTTNLLHYFNQLSPDSNTRTSTKQDKLF